MDSLEVDPSLVALRGFCFGCVGATSRILVNVNIFHSAFYRAIPLSDLVTKYNPGAWDYSSLQEWTKPITNARLCRPCHMYPLREVWSRKLLLLGLER